MSQTLYRTLILQSVCIQNFGEKLTTLKWKGSHVDSFFITGCTGSAAGIEKLVDMTTFLFQCSVIRRLDCIWG